MAKVDLSLCSMMAVLFMLATTRIEIPPPPAPFDVPAFVPDDATKKRALIRAYEIVGGIQTAWGDVDVSKEESVIRLQQRE